MFLTFLLFFNLIFAIIIYLKLSKIGTINKYINEMHTKTCPMMSQNSNTGRLKSPKTVIMAGHRMIRKNERPIERIQEICLTRRSSVETSSREGRVILSSAKGPMLISLCFKGFI